MFLSFSYFKGHVFTYFSFLKFYFSYRSIDRDERELLIRERREKEIKRSKKVSWTWLIQEGGVLRWSMKSGHLLPPLPFDFLSSNILLVTHNFLSVNIIAKYWWKKSSIIPFVFMEFLVVYELCNIDNDNKINYYGHMANKHAFIYCFHILSLWQWLVVTILYDPEVIHPRLNNWYRGVFDYSGILSSRISSNPIKSLP